MMNMVFVEEETNVLFQTGRSGVPSSLQLQDRAGNGDTCKVGQAGDGTADKPAHQVSQVVKSHDESRHGPQGNTEDQSACERELADDTVKLQTQVVSSETNFLNLF